MLVIEAIVEKRVDSTGAIESTSNGALSADSCDCRNSVCYPKLVQN